MSRRVEFAPGEYYHIFHRGVDKRTVFTNKGDYARFLATLYLANSGVPMHPSDYHYPLEKILGQQRENTLVHIGAYALMPNHFHLLVHEHSEGGISKFMQKLLTGYTMYFNGTHERTGPLFGGKFRAVHASRDAQLRYLYSYIHLNPLSIVFPKWKTRSGRHPRGSWKDFLLNYTYSSLPDYLRPETRPQQSILTPIAFPEYFENAAEMLDDMAGWIGETPETEALAEALSRFDLDN